MLLSYWPGASLTLDPRLSSRWIINIAFLGSVISLPVPRPSFLITEDPQIYCPVPPPLAVIVENILPLANIKTHLSRGLQHSSALVQHCTALALCKCLTKFGEVVQALTEVRQILQEDDSGLWSLRLQEVEKEVTRRVPEFQVVVAFTQQKSITHNETKTGGTEAARNSTKLALLTESAQRLLWLYHRHLPQVVAEARFDATKLLLSVHNTGTGDFVGGIERLCQLHTLRLLNENEDVSILGKTGMSSLTRSFTGADRHQGPSGEI